MQNPYGALLQAAIDHLEDLKNQGSRFVSVQPAALAALGKPGAVRPAAARPAVLAAPPSAPVIPSVAVPAEPLPMVAPGLTGDAKEKVFAELRARALACRQCPNLAASRANVVWGVGDINAPVLFIGEAPGADEDEQGEPFVGRAGQLLTKIIEAMGFTRQSVYIANILKCRPDTPGQTSGNRPPTPEEIRNCIPYLNAQIDLIQPKAMVALGATAVAGLFGKAAPISKLRGTFMTFRNIPVMPTFHPSYLLRPNGAAAKPLVWDDMLQVLEKLGHPISEKQRGYFRAPR